MGVFDEHDPIPTLKIGTAAIINKPSNEHWIGIFNDGELRTYDSYGRRIIGGDPLKKVLRVPATIKQKDSQSNCGARTLAALVASVLEE